VKEDQEKMVPFLSKTSEIIAWKQEVLKKGAGKLWM